MAQLLTHIESLGTPDDPAKMGRRYNRLEIIEVLEDSQHPGTVAQTDPRWRIILVNGPAVDWLWIKEEFRVEASPPPDNDHPRRRYVMNGAMIAGSLKNKLDPTKQPPPGNIIDLTSLVFNVANMTDQRL